MVIIEAKAKELISYLSSIFIKIINHVLFLKTFMRYNGFCLPSCACEREGGWGREGERLLSNFTWIPVIKLRPLGLCSKQFYMLSHFIGSSFICFYWSVEKFKTNLVYFPVKFFTDRNEIYGW